MKMGIIIVAFVFGCVATAFIRVAPDNAAANAEDAAIEKPVEFEFSKTSTQESQQPTQQQTLDVTAASFGQTSAGRAVQKFTCSNSNGYVLELMDYGAAIVALKVPGKDGAVTNVLLNCSDMASYEACTSYFGCTTGRYCNRIAAGKFSIDGTDYQLATNAGAHHLHGGNVGIDKKVWSSEIVRGADFVGVKFTLTSPDGDEGYPGKLDLTATYSLNEQNQLTMLFQATTDAPTHVNLTNHGYWNIGGAGSGNIMDHELQLSCGQVLENDDSLIPTGKMIDVAGDAFFDFTTSRTIGSGLQAAANDADGYDHCYVVNRKSANELAFVGKVRDPKSGRTMTVHTTQPGVQVYTSNHFDGQPGSGGFEKHAALCLETQHYPDSPNRPEFPTTLLKPGETLSHKTVHTFSVE